MNVLFNNYMLQKIRKISRLAGIFISIMSVLRVGVTFMRVIVILNWNYTRYLGFTNVLPKWNKTG